MIRTSLRHLFFMVVGVALALFPGTFAEAQEGYKVLSYSGTVKIKQGEKVFVLKEPARLILGPTDAVMLYPGASIDLMFPNGRKKTVTGPLYSTLKMLEHPISPGERSLLENAGLWPDMKLMFDKEGDSTPVIIKGRGSGGTGANFAEIKNALAMAPLADSTISSLQKKEMENMLKLVERVYNSFSRTPKVLMRALVFKKFGLDKTSVYSVFLLYKSTRHDKGKQKDRALMEGYMYNKLLPIFVTVHPFKSGGFWGEGQEISQRLIQPFSSNYKLWWAAFYYDNGEVKEIVKTIDEVLEPQDAFHLLLHISPRFRNIGVIKGGGERGDNDVDGGLGIPPSKTKSIAGWSQKDRDHKQLLFIVACSDWKELEKFENLKFVTKQYQKSFSISQGAKTKGDRGRVYFKVPFRDRYTHQGINVCKNLLYLLLLPMIGTVNAAI